MKWFLLISMTWQLANCNSACRHKDHSYFAKVAMITKVNYKLKGHLIQTRFSESQLACSHFCLKNPRCQSLNYKRPSGNDRGLCKLNDRGLSNELDVKETIEETGFVFSQFTRDKGDGSICADSELKSKDLCKDGWAKYKSFCYKVFDELATFYKAVWSCIREGAGLVSIDDFDERHFLDTILVDGEKVLVGLTDIAEKRDWVWMDGSVPTLDPLWHRSHPDGGRDENCAEYVTVMYRIMASTTKAVMKPDIMFANTHCTTCEAFLYLFPVSVRDILDRQCEI